MTLSVEGIVQIRYSKGDWIIKVVRYATRAQMVGKMTAAIKVETFMTDLVIQKRISNLLDSGSDFIEGYLFKGISRQTGVNTVAHYYESIWTHSFYKSGRSGDISEGIIENVQTHLLRVAETDLVRKDEMQFPYPQSVRGIFYGSVYMNPIIAEEKNTPLDGLLQIISMCDPQVGHLANGWFYGTFRGIPEDVDSDGQVELNGVELFVDREGKILEQYPKTKIP